MCIGDLIIYGTHLVNRAIRGYYSYTASRGTHIFVSPKYRYVVNLLHCEKIINCKELRLMLYSLSCKTKKIFYVLKRAVTEA